MQITLRIILEGQSILFCDMKLIASLFFECEFQKYFSVRIINSLNLYTRGWQ